jgi:hypothetical protein
MSGIYKPPKYLQATRNDCADRLDSKTIGRASEQPADQHKRARIVLATSDPDDACAKRSVAAALSPRAR